MWSHGIELLKGPTPRASLVVSFLPLLFVGGGRQQYELSEPSPGKPKIVDSLVQDAIVIVLARLRWTEQVLMAVTVLHAVNVASLTN